MTKPTAVAGQRFAAFVVDTLVICAVIAGLWLLLTDKIPKDQVAPDSGGFDIGDKRYAFSEENSGKRTLWALLSVASAIAVSVVSPALTGSSPGRAAAGIRVVDQNGRKPGIGRASVRWLLWLVDGFFFWAVGGIMVLATRHNQRLGDMAAKTYTVKKEHAGHPLPLDQAAGFAGAYPDQQGGYPAQQGGYPAQQQGGYPAQHGGYPAQAQQQQGPGPGWHADPRGEARLRWWDGSQWTEHTSN